MKHSELITDGICAVGFTVGLLGTPSPHAIRRWLAGACLAVALVVVAIGGARLLRGTEWLSLPAGGVGVAVLLGIVASATPRLLREKLWHPEGVARLLLAATCAAALADLVILDWASHLTGRDADAFARAAAAAQIGVLIPFAWLCRRLLKEMQDREAHQREEDLRGHSGTGERYDFSADRRFGEVAWFRMVALGVAVVTVALGVWAQTGRTSGVDRSSLAPDFPLLALILLGAGALLIAAIGRAVNPPQHAPTSAAEQPAPKPETLILPASVAPPLMCALIVWGVGPHLLTSRYHAVPWCAAFAAILFGATVHSFWFHGVAEHGNRHGAMAWIIGIGGAVSASSALFWLLSAGIWRGGSPVRAADGVVITVVILAGGSFVTSLVFGAVYRHQPTPFLSRYAPQMGVTEDLVTYAGLALIAAVAPAAVAAHVQVAAVSDAVRVTLLGTGIFAIVQAVPLMRLQHAAINRFLREERAWMSAMFGKDPGVQRRLNVIERHFNALIPGQAAALVLGGIWLIVSIA
jgi:hypothetical protein